MRHRPALVLAALLAVSAPAAAQPKSRFADRLAAARAELKPALDDLEASQEAIVAEWIKISEIPAPSRREEKRAAYIAAQFQAAGLEVSRDDIGNVIAKKPGTAGAGKKIVVCAHLDTVFGPETDVRVRREGAKLIGPGIGDDASGLVNLVLTARLLAKHRVTFESDVWLVATVQEELGIVGAKRFMARHKDEVGMVISIDGGFGGVSYGALGIHWWKLRFLGKANHTLGSMDQPSTTLALARTIERIYRLKVPREPEMRRTWYNVGAVGGGSVVNAQAREAWCTVDLRSMDAGELQRLEEAVLGIARAAAYETGVRCEAEPIQKFPAAQLAGMPEHDLVVAAREVLESLGVKKVSLSPLGASDHCAAILLGIPGINIGTATGEGAHSPEEWADSTPARKGIQQTVLLLALLARLARR